MKEIVVISGKGGTGKTSITASFSVLGGQNIITADCDVDAADMHLLLAPDFAKAEDFYSGKIATINEDACMACGNCKKICRFDAIDGDDDGYHVIDLNCEGCGYCEYICPVDAIKMEDNLVGQWYQSSIKTGSHMIHAKLGVGAENSGKLVAKVKHEAKKLAEELSKDLVLVDGSPGIGCPVVSSLSGANLVVFVTEPTVSGVHDVKRVIELVKRFQILGCCIINKANLNEEKTNELIEFLKENDIHYLGNIEYNENFTKSMTNGKTIVEYDNGTLTQSIQSFWDKILNLI